MFSSAVWTRRGMLVSAWLALNFLLASAFAQSTQGNPPGPATAATPPAPASTMYRPSVPRRAQDYYRALWGVDSLTVRSVESGELIRFNYRVVDPVKAEVLSEKKSEPYLFDERARVKLVVPSMEKVGQLRQSSTPEAGKIYWMAFSNKGGLVKRGDQVTVVIGQFRAIGLTVE